MAAIPVTSEEHPVNPPRPVITDEISDNSRRLSILERSGNQTLEERVAAIELFLFGP
jgi:hypothetical protein